MRTGCYSRSSQSGWSGRAVCLNTYQVGTKWFGSYMILDMLASNEDNFFSHYYWMYRRQSSVFCSSCFSLLSLFLQICKGYSFTVPLNVRSVNILQCGFFTDLNSDLIQHKIFSKWPFFRRVVLKGVQKNFWFNFDFCFTTVSMCARKGRKIKNEKVYRQFKIKAFAALTDQRQNWNVSILQILCACIKTETWLTEVPRSKIVANL